MDFPKEFYQFAIAIMALCVLWGFTIYFSKGRIPFRSSRNKRARKQL